MSYCRFSSDNWKSDVYVYQDVRGGWTTHVAGGKRVIPPAPDILFSRIGDWLYERSGGAFYPTARLATYANPGWAQCYRWWARFATFWHNRIHMASLRMIPLRPIGLAYDGETFTDDSPGECADRLEYLRALGYHVPQSAIDSLREEAEEGAMTILPTPAKRAEKR